MGGLINKQDRYGWTGLMWALCRNPHSVPRWLISLPGLDTNIRNNINTPALHYACCYDAPLDIVTSLARLSSWETVDVIDIYGSTALDLAVMTNNTSAVLYLSWLGADCKEESRKFKEVTLHTWT